MKYSEFLELIHKYIVNEHSYLCRVVSIVWFHYPVSDEHVKKFRKYIKRLLLKTKKLTGSEERSCAGFTLTPLLEKRYGSEMNRAELRRLLIKDLISYHEKRGN